MSAESLVNTLDSTQLAAAEERARAALESAQLKWGESGEEWDMKSFFTARNAHDEATAKLLAAKKREQAAAEEAAAELKQRQSDEFERTVKQLLGMREFLDDEAAKSIEMSRQLIERHRSVMRWLAEQRSLLVRLDELRRSLGREIPAGVVSLSYQGVLISIQRAVGQAARESVDHMREAHGASALVEARFT